MTNEQLTTESRAALKEFWEETVIKKEPAEIAEVVKVFKAKRPKRVGSAKRIKIQ